MPDVNILPEAHLPKKARRVVFQGTKEQARKYRDTHNQIFSNVHREKGQADKPNDREYVMRQVNKNVYNVLEVVVKI